MKTSFPRVAVTLLPALAVIAFAVQPGPAAPGPAEAKPRVVPDCAAQAIVKEANQFIQDPLGKPRRSMFQPVEIRRPVIRANALMIALVAQNRMNAPGADTGRLVALRDATLKLVAEIDKSPLDVREVLRLADLLNRFPAIPTDRNASRAPVRLKGVFDHDDILGLVASCGKTGTQRIERELFSFTKSRTPFIKPEQADRVELVAYKVALIAELNREMDKDFVPEKRKHERPEWVKFADEVQHNAWQLAELARGGNSADIQRGVAALNTSCSECHAKFRDCN